MKKPIQIFFYYLVIGILSGVAWIYLPKINPSRFSFFKPGQVQMVDSLLSNDLGLSADTSSLNPMISTYADTLPTVFYESAHLSYSSRFLKSLESTYAQMNASVDSNFLVRVLHMGDSQVEGDRITSSLRERFQDRFGGSGPGLIIPNDPFRLNPSVTISNSSNWQLAYIYNAEQRVKGLSYGVLGGVAKVVQYDEAWFQVGVAKWAGTHTKNYQRIGLFIAPHEESIAIKGTIGTTIVIADSLSGTTALTEIAWQFAQLSPTLKLEFSGADDLVVLACSLDSTCGVAVDNVALRGQSTPLLNRTDGKLYQTMASQLNVGLIFFQFGTNMVPLNASNYTFYKSILERQFSLLMRFYPNTPVVVIGVADAAEFKDGHVSAFSHIDLLRKVQREAALKYDFAFFDLYAAMGGSGSMEKWVNSSPALALADHIHFTRRGGDKAAGYIFNSLVQVFDKIDRLNVPLSTVNLISDRLLWLN